MDRAQDDLYSLLGGAASGMEAPIGDPKIPCAPRRNSARRCATIHGADDQNAPKFALPLP